MNPQIPSTITPETLAKIPDDQLWYVLFEYASAAQYREIAGQQPTGEVLKGALAALPFGLRMIYHMNAIEFEVPNGGFSQFFYNVEGAWVSETLEAFRRIGANKRTDILDRAIKLFEREAGRPRDHADRWMGPWFDSPELDELDRQYPVVWHPAVVAAFSPEERQRYERQAPEEELRGFERYVREHPEEFFHP